MATRVYLTTTGAGKWVTPNGVTAFTVECIGAGSDGTAAGGGGAGGAYAKSVLTLTANTEYSFSVGAGGGTGGDTWFGAAAFPTTGQACGARGGGAASVGTGGTGGPAGNGGGTAGNSYWTGTGSGGFSGGNGGSLSTDPGGGGGAAGPNGVGRAGGNGTGSASGNGGNGDLDLGGAGGAGSATTGGNGGVGTEQNSTNSSVVCGSGGGGGGGITTGGNGGNYGAGGGAGLTNKGNGSQGIIIITYTSTSPAIFFLINSPGTNQIFVAPDDWNNSNNKIETIGAGASGASGSTGHNTGGGAGAYNIINNFTFAAPGTTTATYRVGLGGAAVNNPANGNDGGDTWFNATAFPTTGTAVGAKGGVHGVNGLGNQSGGAGGDKAAGFPTTSPPGQSGGRGGNMTGASGTGASGGGGAAGPTGAGGNGVDTTSTGSGVTTNGGTNDQALAGGTAPGGAGGNGIDFDATHGAGSGGAGNSATTGSGGAGGNYGAGGGGMFRSGGGATVTSGAGILGIVVVTYTPAGSPFFKLMKPIVDSDDPVWQPKLAISDLLTPLLTAAGQVKSKQWLFGYDDPAVWVGEPTQSPPLVPILTSGGIVKAKRQTFTIEHETFWQGTPTPSHILIPILTAGGQVKPSRWNFNYDQESPWQLSVGRNANLFIVSAANPFVNLRWNYSDSDDPTWRSYARNQLLLAVPFTGHLWRFNPDVDVAWQAKTLANQNIFGVQIRPFVNPRFLGIDDSSVWQGFPSENINMFFVPLVLPFSNLRTFNYDVGEAIWRPFPPSTTIIIPPVPITTTAYKVIPVDAAFGSDLVLRGYRFNYSNPIFVGDAAALVMEAGFESLTAAGSLSLTVTKPDGTSFVVANPQVYDRNAAAWTGLGRFTGGTYVVYTFAAGELSQPGTWQVTLTVNGISTSAVGYFTVLPI